MTSPARLLPPLPLVAQPDSSLHPPAFPAVTTWAAVTRLLSALTHRE